MAAQPESWCERAMALADQAHFRTQETDIYAQLEKDTMMMHKQNQKKQLALQNINRTLQDILSINSKLVEKKEQLHRMVSQQEAVGLLHGFQDTADGQLSRRPAHLQVSCESGAAGHAWPTRCHQPPEPSPVMRDAIDVNNPRWLHALEEASNAPSLASTQHGVLSKHSTTLPKPQEGKLGVNRPLRDMPPGTTTLCIRNIPSRYSMDQLLREFVVDGSFDLIHRPFNSNGNKKVGYVFINFVNPEAAVRFQHHWHGKFLENHGPTRALDVTSATIQGYEATLLPFTKRMLEFTHASQLPVTFKGTKRLDTMQEATRLARMSEGKRQ